MRDTITIHTADIQGAIFDVDGTLLDSMPAWHDAGARFLKTLGIEAEPNLGDILFAETTSSGADYMIRRYHLQMTKDEVAEGIIAQMDAFYRDEVQQKPGAVSLLKTLKEAGIPSVVVTSTEGSCIEEAFNRLDLHQYFRRVFSAQDLHTTKKEPLFTPFDQFAAFLASRVPCEDGRTYVEKPSTELRGSGRRLHHRGRPRQPRRPSGGAFPVAI